MNGVSRSANVMGADIWDGDPEIIWDTDITGEVNAFFLREARLLDMRRLREWLAQMIDKNIRYVIFSRQLRYKNDKRYNLPDEVFIYDDDYECLNARVEQFHSELNWRVNPDENYQHMVANTEIAQKPGSVNLFVRSNWFVQRARRQYEIDRFVYCRHDELARDSEGKFKVVARHIDYDERCVSGRNMTMFL